MEQKRERVIAMRVTEAEYGAIRDAANREKRPVSDYLRLRFLEILEAAHRS